MCNIFKYLPYNYKLYALLKIKFKLLKSLWLQAVYIINYKHLKLLFYAA